MSCKRIFCNIEFFIKNISFKEIVRFVRILMTHPVYAYYIIIINKIKSNIFCIILKTFSHSCNFVKFKLK